MTLNSEHVVFFSGMTAISFKGTFDGRQLNCQHVFCIRVPLSLFAIGLYSDMKSFTMTQAKAACKDVNLRHVHET